MIEIMKSHKSEIERYCRANGLSVEKVFSASRAWCEEWEILQYIDPALNNGEGLRKDCAVPAPIMLEINLEDGKLRFKQTEHTYRLLADEPARTPVKREPLPLIPANRKPSRVAAMA